MNTRKLYELRKDRMTIQNSPDQFYEIATTIFKDCKRVQVPLVFGPKDSGEDQWKVQYLSPKTVSDRLTIENFLEGVRIIRDEYSPELFRYFHSKLIFEGVDSEKNIPNNTSLIDISLTNGGKASHNLSIIYSEHAYTARTTRDIQALERAMKNHMGPN
ncbi:hypothetical protein GOV14_01730 [Candidatus Pacearchaeota archaeon]|nr:hypothetical protein [Candidatus Pacearchaeota archaeon]